MVYIKLLVTMAIWGGTFIAGRIVSKSVDPYSAAFLRFLIASICLSILLLYKEKRFQIPNFRQMIGIVALGLTGVFGYNICFFMGLKSIEAGRASLIIATNPVFISIFSAMMLNEHLNMAKAGGIVLSVTGAMLVISRGNIHVLTSLGIGRGELLICGCVICWVTYSLVGKITMARLSPLAAVCYSSIVGTIFLMIPGSYHHVWSNLAHYAPVVWINLGYLGVFGTTLGFVWYYEGIRSIGAMKAGVFINFVPVSAIILSFFILREPITKTILIGALFVITGVYITNSYQLLKRKFA